MPDPSPADWLSDAEAEAMDRARDPEFWDRIDRLRRSGAANMYNYHTAQARGLTAEALAAIRRAWAARPETARALDIALTTGGLPQYAGIDAIKARHDHLLAKGESRG